VLRAFSATVLLVVVAAGCGGADRSGRSAPGEVPQALARSWEGQASAIANAVSTGDSCRALQLAASLRDEVGKSEHKLPRRLRSPLLSGVNALADRITCTPPVTSVPRKPPKPPPDEHGGHGHHGHHGHGQGNAGGNDQ
jgi:hypothetical protein